MQDSSNSNMVEVTAIFQGPSMVVTPVIDSMPNKGRKVNIDILRENAKLDTGYKCIGYSVRRMK